MLIWQGYGLLALGPPLALLIGLEVVLNAIAEPETYHHLSTFPGGIALILAGPPTWALARWLNRRTPVRRLIDPATGEDVVLRAEHKFFFLAVERWAVIWPVIGVVSLINAALHGFRS